MYDITIILTEHKMREKLYAEKTISGEDRKELESRIEETINEMCKTDKFVSPIAEYVLTKNGMYIDGETDLKVKVRKGVASVKLGGLNI